MKFNLRLAAMAVCGLTTAFVSCKKQDLNQVSGSDNPATKGALMAAYQSTAGAQPGAVMIKFREGCQPGNIVMHAADGAVRTGIEKVDQAGVSVGIKEMTRIFRHAPKFEEQQKKHGLDRWYKVTFDESVSDLNRAIASYESLDEIEHVETVKTIRMIDDSPSYAYDGLLAFGLRQTDGAAQYPFNDPMLKDQWHYDKGDKATTRESSIYLFDAWEAKSGDPRVIVSIVDGGVRFDHPDLYDNYHQNMAEVNGIEGVDDDGNGYIDDYYGWNFITNRSGIQSTSHGTHVAGTVAAVNNNGIGVSGVAGGTGHKDGCQVISCQILNDNNQVASDDMTAEAITYGVYIGSVISQNSWSYTNPGYRSKVVEDAIDFFIAEAGNYAGAPMKGGIVIFAAGNSSSNAEYFPCAYESCIAVAASDQQRKLGSYSNYGNSVDITAPGGHRTETQYMVLSTNHGPDGDYSYKYGTSMAAPHVSGVTALLVAANYGTFTSETLRAKLLSSVEIFNEAGSGSGLLNASKFLKSDPTNEAPGQITDLTALDKDNTVVLEWRVPKEASMNRITKYNLYYSESQLSESNLAQASKLEVTDFYWLPEGTLVTFDLTKIMGLNLQQTHYFAVTAQDKWGNISKLSNVAQYPNGGGSGEINLSSVLVRTTVTVSWNATFEGDKTIKLYDRAGRAVLKSCAPQGQSSVQLDLSKLAVGNYTVQVAGSNGTHHAALAKI